ncbi:GNAT family N-acetyltransferase [Flexivirga caeni]|uniref:N-acetyltransferase n=1 Tax=Flexivirga caeni TaxID=2294115 RepID=A0A3M9MEC9_9MICO|nr:GNAT family N-acetyltransferase [Flexivirga caeni]RNI23193.1 N-acetyltransferase [Flexivirga caeni]
MREPKVLAAQGIRLRPWRDDDVVLVPDEVSRTQIVTDLQPDPEAYAGWLCRRRERIASGELLAWCVADPDTDEALGYIQLAHLNTPFTRGNGELGYWLYPHARGRGLMGAAVELVRKHAFGEVGLRRLQAGTTAGNLASARVLRRAGFRMWGIERAVLSRGDGPPADALNWELLASDDVDAQRVSPRVIPTVELRTVRLRPWRDDDVAHLPEHPDERMVHYLPAGAHLSRGTFPAWLTRQRGFIDEARTVGWCIADAATDAALGSVSIFNIGEGTISQAEVGYWLLPAGRGRGALSEALEAVVLQAFSAPEEGGLGLTRLYAETDLDNIASQTALRRAGFRQWGTDRQAYTAADGRITDGAYFELLATDDRAAQRAVTPPVLDFPDVRLRPLRTGDADAIATTFADPVVRHWLAMPAAGLAERAAAYIAAKRWVDLPGPGCWWVICRPEGDDFVGVIGVQNVEDGNAEIGYWLAAHARGCGLATAAVGAVATYAFLAESSGGLGLRRLRIGIADGNISSQGVAGRAGFTSYGRARQAEVLGDGSVTDLLLFERLAGDPG